VSRLKGLILPAVLILLAEAVFRIYGVGSDALAPPSAIVMAFGRSLMDGTLLAASIETLGSAAIGLTIGAAIGISLGICLGLSSRLARASFLAIEAFRALPAIALMPLVLLAYGFGYRTEIAIVAFASIWPTLLMSQQAVRSIFREQIEVARTLQLSPAKILQAIILPAIAERLFTALRLSVGLALVVAVTVEIFGNPQGLGYAISISEQNLDPALSLSMLLWVGAVGFLLNAALIATERRAFAWKTKVAR
jgi:sulfonate transport system permease protein